MRFIRDFILVISAITTAACAIYVVVNIEIAKVYLGDTSAPWGPFIKSQMGGATVDDILKRLKELPSDGALPGAAEGYNKSALEGLRKQIDRSGAK